MKNILARGGIEFLAVILGISGSLWLDDNNTYKNDRKQEYEAYDRLSNALSQDIMIIDNALIENDRRLEILESMMKNIEKLSDDTLSTYIDQTQNYVNINPHISDYETLKNTGRLYKIRDIDLLQKIIDLYDNKYGVIESFKVEDKRAIFMQDEYYINNYSMQPSPVWTTLKNVKQDRKRLMNDMVYQNYIVFLYKVKSAVKRRWTGLKDEILSVQKDIQSKIDQKES
tara:strand:+ start:44 stop:727 length:684 start_codon:yes stop_codon:yes gene_type:complete